MTSEWLPKRWNLLSEQVEQHSLPGDSRILDIFRKARSEIGLHLFDQTRLSQLTFHSRPSAKSALPSDQSKIRVDRVRTFCAF
jgi:hypothetical protein